jgi:hypothetical protein
MAKTQMLEQLNDEGPGDSVESTGNVKETVLQSS